LTLDALPPVVDASPSTVQPLPSMPPSSHMAPSGSTRHVQAEAEDEQDDLECGNMQEQEDDIIPKLEMPAPVQSVTSMDSIPTTLVSATLVNPRMQACTREELESAVRHGSTDIWIPGTYSRHARSTLLEAIKLVCVHARGGAFVCIAPPDSFRSVFGDTCAKSRSEIDKETGPSIKVSDGGYMTDKLKGIHISDPQFADLFAEFSTHTADDRWPADHPDPQARSRPKDGALLLATSGYRLKCAVKLLGLPASHAWRHVGTKHEAAMACAWAVEDACVLVRSDGGTVSFLTRVADSLEVWQIWTGGP